MIDKTHELPIVRQCKILELARSTAYYHERPHTALDDNTPDEFYYENLPALPKAA
jgi:transposase InsO family protein